MSVPAGIWAADMKPDLITTDCCCLNSERERALQSDLGAVMGDSVLLLLLLLTILQPLQGLLFPRDSPSRSSKSLDGVWNFKLSPKLDQDAGFRESWFNEPLSHLGLRIILKIEIQVILSTHRWCSWDACSGQLQWHHYKYSHINYLLHLTAKWFLI